MKYAALAPGQVLSQYFGGLRMERRGLVSADPVMVNGSQSRTSSEFPIPELVCLGSP